MFPLLHLDAKLSSILLVFYTRYCQIAFYKLPIVYYYSSSHSLTSQSQSLLA